MEVNPTARNWYVPVHHPDTDYYAELGFFDQEGAWRKVAASAVAHTPPDALASEERPVDFATVPAHLTFERLLSHGAGADVRGRDADGRAGAGGRRRARRSFKVARAPLWTDEQKRLLAALLGDSLIDRVGLGSAEIDQLLRKQLGDRLTANRRAGSRRDWRGSSGCSGRARRASSPPSGRAGARSPSAPARSAAFTCT